MMVVRLVEWALGRRAGVWWLCNGYRYSLVWHSRCWRVKAVRRGWVRDVPYQSPPFWELGAGLAVLAVAGVYATA